MTPVHVGRIVRLQLQLSSLKEGGGRLKHYDPAPILPVDNFLAAAEGVSLNGADGPRLDVHHARHPMSKNRALTNSLSIGFTSHYRQMRERFGAHLIDGIAGENILIETDRQFDLAALEGGLVIERADGSHVRLGSVSVAHPCVEFSRFALGDPVAAPLVVSEALRFLDDGMRGFYAVVQSDEPQPMAVGDRVCLVTS